MAKTTEGQGTTSGKSSEVMLAEKRSRKATQNHNARAVAHSRATSGGGYLDGLMADRRQRDEERRAARAAEGIASRATQVTMARATQPVTSLKAGSPARKVAELVLDWFEKVEPETDEHGKVVRSRTKVAQAEAEHDAPDGYSEAVVRLGLSRAAVALRIAFNQLKQNNG